LDKENKNIGLKIVPDEMLDELIPALGIQEIVEFFATDPRPLEIDKIRFRQMYVGSTGDVVKVLA
jgi:hypothetical protein